MSQDEGPTDEELAAKVEALLPTVNLETMGVKQFIKILSKEFGNVDLKPRKNFIRTSLANAINKANADDEEEEEEEEEDDEESEEEEEQKAKPRSKGKGGGGLKAKKLISDKLAAFLGQGNQMSRTDIVSSLWDHIRENNLQNPKDKREIILDDAMKEVFGCDTFTMFSMNKYVSAHVEPFKPVDLTSTPTKSSRAKRKAAPSPKGQKSPAKRKKGTQPPYRLSEDLQKVVGCAVLPRPQVVSKIWVYIKAHNLQNEKDKREILCDDVLFAVMKKKKVSMFKMNQLITPHLLEKADRSEYVHEDENNSGSDSD